MKTLLPPHSTSKLERDLSLTFAQIIELPVEIQKLWDVKTCPPEFLSYLAQAMQTDFWDENWSDDLKREFIANMFSIYKIKGTIASIKRIFKLANFDDITIIEKSTLPRYDGKYKYDGTIFYDNEELKWAEYKVYLQKPISQKQTGQIKKLLEMTAPKRSQLTHLHFEKSPFTYDGTIFYNGEFTYGAIE